MKVLFYISRAFASDEEQDVVRSLEKSGGRVLLRNVQFWRGETEPCDKCIAGREDVREAYAADGIPAEPPAPSGDSEGASSEAQESASYEVVAKGGGWYDVVSPEGDVVNEKSLRQEDADALAKELS